MNSQSLESRGWMVGCDSANVPVPSACICVHLRFQFLASFGAPMTAAYAELQTTTNYSFLRGASHVEELFAQAAMLGLPALGITDRNSLAGIVRAHQRAQEAGVRLIVGCRLDLTDGTVAPGLPHRPPRLCAPLPPAHHRQEPRRQRRLRPRLGRPRRARRGPDRHPLHPTRHAEKLQRLKADLRRPRLCGPDSATPPQRRGPPATDRRSRAPGARVPTVATGDVLYHAPQPPHPAGCADLHPRGLHHRRCRLPPRALRRSPPETAGGNGAAVRPPSGRRRAHAGDRRTLPLLARRTALPISARSAHPRPDRAADAGTTDAGKARHSAIPTACRTT